MSAGGLSFTGAMSDFSLYIFHPYGGGVQRKLNTSPGYNLGKVNICEVDVENGCSTLKLILYTK